MLMRAVRWGLAGVLVAWTVIRLLGWDLIWPVVPLLALTPLVGVLAVVGALIALVRRDWLLALVGAGCAAALVAAIAPRATQDSAQASPEGVRVRVLAANVAGEETVGPQIVALARRLHVDVMAIAELTQSLPLVYEKAHMDAVLPERWLRPYWGFRGTGLYAKVPLRAAPAPYDPALGIAVARANVPGARPVLFAAVHTLAPDGPRDVGDWKRALRALPSAGKGPPRVLLGDFNATLDHAALRRLIARGYRDAADQVGSGLQMTWPAGKWPVPALLAIDHVLVDRRIRVVSFRTVAIPGSDHRGVLADLVLPRG